jgi:hypothetical protein
MRRAMPTSLRSSSTRSAPASANAMPIARPMPCALPVTPAIGRSDQTGSSSCKLAPRSGMARPQITIGLLPRSQPDDRAVVILTRLGHGEDTMGTYIATAGIAGRAGGPGAIRGLGRAGVQTGINLTVSMKEERLS